MTKVKGRIEVNQTLFTFIDLSPPAEDGSKHDFSYKQNGPKAAEALNVFYYCSYERAVDLDKITNPVERSSRRSYCIPESTKITTAFILQLSPDMLVSISKSYILGCNSWMAYDKDRGFLLEIDATTTNLKNRKRIFGPLHPSQMPHSQMFAISTDGKLLYAGGIWDNSLRVYSLHKGKTLASVTRHLGNIK
ncbi:Neurobeachin-like protein 1 [Eumeta japonica]|uniref:Neurobeachin-like protein 1 n=1 Tax=Eumeta variegata TaxID=151549 RepID=A0A4C1SVE7_EUMVA|nr:Neurobeachin-like protein 1 [Eumeta japonica]